jgi:hypothetical protein
MPPRLAWLLRLESLRLALGLALFVAGACVIIRFLPPRAFANDFSMAYLSARALSQGLDPYTLSLDQYAQNQNVPVTEVIAQATNPPLLLWVLRPFGRLSPVTAFWLYVGVEVIAFALCILIAYRLLGRQFSTGSWCLAAGLVFCSMPMFMHFWCSQVQLPLLALVMGGALALRTGWPRLACLLLAMAAVLKIYPAPLVVLPTLSVRGSKRWTLAGWTALCIIGWAVLPGWKAWISFISHGLPLLAKMASGRYYNFTVSSAVMDLWRPAPRTEWLAAAVALTISAALFAWWACFRRTKSTDVVLSNRSLSQLLVTSVMCSTVAWAHYLVWLFFPLCVVAIEAGRANGRRQFWLVGLLLVALACFNAAGSNPLGLTDRVGKFSNASAPLLVMILLSIHFSREQES